ncbi:MAG: DMP19 family protein, partial [Planctomycetota bacterium]
EIFSSIDRWAPDDPDFKTLNRELFSAGSKLERRRLLDVISIAENAADAADTDMAAEARSSVGPILKLLALHHDVKDEPLFQRYRKSKDFMLAGDAIDAFLVSRREPTVDEFAGSLYRRKEQNEPLSGEERKLVALFDCDGQINNGGLDQYFFNSYADTWPDAIAGYELVGAKEHLKIVRQAVRKFGRSGPSVDRDQRQAQLSRLLNKNKGVFDKLTDRYFNVSSTVNECVTRYRIDT